jgi:hypothetical protein
MPSLKSYFKISKPTVGNASGPKQAPSTPLTSNLPLASQSEKDFSDWPRQPEPGRSDAVSSSIYSQPDAPDTPLSGPEAFANLQSEVIVNWIYLKQEEKIWTTGQPGEGVVLREAKGRYVCCPTGLQYDDSNFYQMVAKLNVCVCLCLVSLSTGLF